MVNLIPWDNMMNTFGKNMNLSILPPAMDK